MRTLIIASLIVSVGGCQKETARAGAVERPAAGTAALGGPANKPAAKAAPKGKPYKVTIEAPAGKAGETLTASIRLVPLGIYKVNQEYPTKLTVQGPQDAAPQQQVMKRENAAKFSKAEALFEPTVKIAKAGEHKFSAEFKFSVCTDELCELKTDKLSWVASVK